VTVVILRTAVVVFGPKDLVTVVILRTAVVVFGPKDLVTGRSPDSSRGAARNAPRSE